MGTEIKGTSAVAISKLLREKVGGVEYAESARRGRLKVERTFIKGRCWVRLREDWPEEREVTRERAVKALQEAGYVVDHHGAHGFAVMGRKA